MADEKKKLQNTGKTILVAGQIRIPPGGTIEIRESRIPEGLRRLIGTIVKEVK